MKKFLLVLLCLTALFISSCNQTESSDTSHNSSNEEKIEKLTPPDQADYTTRDIEYSVNISDPLRSVSFDATRSGGINTVTLSAPEELSGIILTDDAGTLRIFPTASRDTELTLSEEAAAGLAVIFNIMEKQVSPDEFTENGLYEFDLNGYHTSLALSDDGYPLTATISKDGYIRNIEFSVTSAP